MLIAETKSRSTINIIHRDQTDAETVQRSGPQRMSAISAAHGVTPAVCSGTLLAAHQELNSSETTPFRWVMVRSTPEPLVVNISNDFWGH